MKRIKKNSRENKFNFKVGDYVYELDKPIKLTEEVVGFFEECATFVNDVSWECCCEYIAPQSHYSFRGLALHSAPEKKINNVVNEFVKKYKVNIINQYKIIN